MSVLRKRPNRAKPANDYVLPEEKLEQRELAFAMYRDMGRRRSFPALERELKRNHSEIAVSRQSLEKWSKAHQRAQRVTVYDQAAAAAQPQQVNPDVDPNFDQVASLLGAANQAIMRAMSTTPAIVPDACLAEYGASHPRELPPVAASEIVQRAVTETSGANFPTANREALGHGIRSFVHPAFVAVSDRVSLIYAEAKYIGGA
jgi:hypothetical protein